MPPRMEPSEFYFAPGTPYPGHLAQAVGKELLKLRDDLGRGPKDRDVLAYAKGHPTSALHQCFEWDQASAAEQHWLATAGSLLRSIKIRVVVLQPESVKKGPREVVVETRLFHNVDPIGLDRGTVDGRVYLPATETLSNFQYRTQLLERALQDLDRWRRIHAHYHELNVFFEKIDEANKAFGRDKELKA